MLRNFKNETNEKIVRGTPLFWPNFSGESEYSLKNNLGQWLMAPPGPWMSIFTVFGIFTLFLFLKNVKLNEREDMMNWGIYLHSHGSLENIRMDNMASLALYRA